MSVSNQPDFPLRVVLIGCGAISQQMHLPVLAGHDDVNLVAVVDKDISRARSIARDYQVPQAVSDIDELDHDDFDAAIVATPPFHHADCSERLLSQGVHVLVEKPMAINYEDCENLVQVADQSRAILHVSVFRRLYPSLRLLRGLINERRLGDVQSFSLRSGGIYGWQAATLGNMRKDLAGGGILMDMGPHHIDQLFAIFDGPARVIRYRDDASGGCEANCSADLEFTHRGRQIEGEIALSRTRSLRNSLQVQCERGTLEVGFSERYAVKVIESENKAYDPFSKEKRATESVITWKDEPETDWYDSFRNQLDDWLNAIRGTSPGFLSGKSCLPSMKIIEQCYAQREPLVNSCDEDQRFASVSGDVKRVLVTGASGFIGCRVVEALSKSSNCEVRAMVRNPGNAARLARLEVELVQADLKDPNQVQQAIQGCDTVIHCAVGTDYWSDRAVAAVTIGGTKNLLQQATKAGVKRFVHLSSIAVHNSLQPGAIDSNTPTSPSSGDHYGQTKLKAEQLVLKACQNGLSAIVLRPGCVYGPYGSTFTTRPLDALAQEKLVLEGSANTSSNTVFVDNLVNAIIAAVNVAPDYSGRCYPISDGKIETWGEFYSYFAIELGKELHHRDLKTSDSKSNRSFRFLGMTEVLASPEFRGLLRKIAYTKPIGSPILSLTEKLPGPTDWIKRKLGGGGGAVYRPSSVSTIPELVITPRLGTISITAAQTDLGYEAFTSNETAKKITLNWWQEFRSE